ncbi:MAG: DNA polymerase [Candidatus Micrarchaeaceae archaeon]
MKIFILDCESYNNGDKIEFGLAVVKEYDKDNFLYFYSREDVKDWLLHGDLKHIYIHNGLKFDLELIFGYRELLNYDLKLNNGKLYKAKIGRSIVYDSYLLIPKSLKKIGEDIGLVKGNLQKELAIMKKDEFEKRKNEIEEYCKNDVIILERALEWFFEFVKSQGVKRYSKYLTIASLSFKVISKKSFLNFSIHKSRNKKVLNPFRNLFLLSYYGARTEAFYSGFYQGQIFTYDFNSLYPSVLNQAYPDQFLFAKKNLTDDELKNILISNYEGLGYFEIDAPKGVFGFYNENNNFIDIGLLPYRDQKQNKLIFPIGKYYGWYNLNEIRFAITHGYKIRAITLYVFSRQYYYDVYDVIKQFYELRKKDKQNSYLYKLMINSFYGKFGERNRSEKYILDQNVEFDNEKYDYYVELDNNDQIKYIIQKDKKAKLTNHTDFSIASYIASWGRIKLLEKFEQVIQNNGKIFYCDTDSIFTNIKLNTSDKIGEIKLENEGDAINIIGQKSYSIFKDNKEIIKKRKGIPNMANIVDKNDNQEIYEYEHIVQLKNGLKKYNDFSREIVKKKVQYTYKRQKGKGFLQALILDMPSVIINGEYEKWEFSSLKEFFDYVNIEYPYQKDIKINYS